MANDSAVPLAEEDQQSSRIASAYPISPQAQSMPNTTQAGIDIDAWTISALQSLSVSPIARGTGSPLAIPIDTRSRTINTNGTPRVVKFDRRTPSPPSPPQRPRSRRDSMEKREALLKGKEGSRQRRRWENDRLIGVPNVQPPQPTDWEVRPTHPIRRMPYQLAQFWDRGVRQLVEDKTFRLQAARKKQQLQKGSATGLGIGEVPRDLRESAKRTPVVKDWVRSLEEPVRQFIHSTHQSRETSDESGRHSDAISDEDGLDSEDEEIVFAGRSGALQELREKKERWRKAHREVSRERIDSGMVFDSFGEDESASYKRWLTHSISDYYGLESRSVVLTNPSRKVVYVGFKQTRCFPWEQQLHLPRPLWQAC